MKANLVCEEYSYCGSVKSIEHDINLKMTFVHFTGSIIKAIPDKHKINYAILTNAMIDTNENINLKFSCKL